MAIAPERVTQLTGTDFDLVVYPVAFNIRDNPATNQKEMSVDWVEYLRIDNSVWDRDFGRRGVTRRNFSDVGTATPAGGQTDPNTGADLSNISIRGALDVILAGWEAAYVADNP